MCWNEQNDNPPLRGLERLRKGDYFYILLYSFTRYHRLWPVPLTVTFRKYSAV